MRQRNSIEKFIKVEFNSSNNLYSKVGFNKVENNFDVNTSVTSDEEVYYDGVIYYDGGDVKGYGDS